MAQIYPGMVSRCQLPADSKGVEGVVAEVCKPNVRSGRGKHGKFDSEISASPTFWFEWQLSGSAEYSFVSSSLDAVEENQDIERQKVIIKQTAITLLAGTVNSDPIWASLSIWAVAGADATGASIVIFILAMTLNPEVQTKAQAEIDRVLENGRLPDFNDWGSLPYVTAMMKEVLRYVYHIHLLLNTFILPSHFSLWWRTCDRWQPPNPQGKLLFWSAGQLDSEKWFTWNSCPTPEHRRRFLFGIPNSQKLYCHSQYLVKWCLHTSELGVQTRCTD